MQRGHTPGGCRQPETCCALSLWCTGDPVGTPAAACAGAHGWGPGGQVPTLGGGERLVPSPAPHQPERSGAAPLAHFQGREAHRLSRPPGPTKRFGKWAGPGHPGRPRGCSRAPEPSPRARRPLSEERPPGWHSPAAAGPAAAGAPAPAAGAGGRTGPRRGARRPAPSAPGLLGLWAAPGRRPL